MQLEDVSFSLSSSPWKALSVFVLVFFASTAHVEAWYKIATFRGIKICEAHLSVSRPSTDATGILHTVKQNSCRHIAEVRDT